MEGNTDETLQLACQTIGQVNIEFAYADGICKEKTTELSFTDYNANYEFDEGIDFLENDLFYQRDVDADECCRRAPLGDLEVLAACAGRADLRKGKHVYDEAKEECRFVGTDNIEFFDNSFVKVQSVTEEVDEEVDQ